MVRHDLLQLILLCAVGVAGCASEDPDSRERGDRDVSLTAEETLFLRTMWPLPALPPSPTNAYADDPWAIQLGHYLFFEPELSRDGDVSCATCHIPDLGWSDGLRLGEGIEQVDMHTPSLINAGHSRWSFWDGRCDTLWCQAVAPFEDQREMGSNRLRLAHTIDGDPELRRAYVETFGPLPDMSDWPLDGRPVPGDPTHEEHQAWASLNPEQQHDASTVMVNLGKALEAFERTIVSRDSPFDRFAEALLVDGDPDNGHLSSAAKRGLRLFIGDAQCHFCHAGPGFTNREFANIGLGGRDWLDPEERGRLDGVIALWDNPFRGDGSFSDDPDAGSIKLENLATTGEQAGQFKVPTLRDVALHPPYMHGGQFETLEAAVEHYGTVTETPLFGHREDLLTDVSLTEAEVQDLVAFLEALTGVPLSQTMTRQPESPLFSP